MGGVTAHFHRENKECPGPDSNRHGRLRPGDFKSVAALPRSYAIAARNPAEIPGGAPFDAKKVHTNG